MSEYSETEHDDTAVSEDLGEQADTDAPEVEAVVAEAAEAVSVEAPFDGVEVPHTADERVDEVLAGLLALAGAPVGDHVAIYDSVHRGLRDCLADLEHTPNPTRPGQPQQGQRPGQPGPGQFSPGQPNPGPRPGQPSPGGMRPSPGAFGR